MNLHYIEEFGEDGEIKELIRPVINSSGNSTLLIESTKDYINQNKTVVFCLDHLSQADYIKSIFSNIGIELNELDDNNNKNKIKNHCT